MSNAKIYEFRDSLSFFMKYYALSEIKKNSLVVHLYKKFENEIKKSGDEIIGLQTMTSICTEKNDTVYFDKNTIKIKKIIKLSTKIIGNTWTNLCFYKKKNKNSDNKCVNYANN